MNTPTARTPPSSPRPARPPAPTGSRSRPTAAASSTSTTCWQLTRNTTPAPAFSRTSRELFLAPGTTEEKLTGLGHGGQHSEILTNFTAAILDGVPLIAPAPEGLNAVELANAMLLSAWTEKTVDLPLDAKLYEKWLKKKIAGARRR